MDETIHLSTVFDHGRYWRWTADDVAKHDPMYIKWLDRDTKYPVGEDVIVEAQLAIERAARGRCEECDND